MQPASVHAVLAGVPDPFPGLRPFESREELIFRGRQQHTDELLRRLASHRFLAVVGTSGSGKSSLVRAGLRPALDRGFLAGATSRWRIAVMRPGMAPIANLREALLDSDALGPACQVELTSSSLALVEAVRGAKLDSGENLLVVADQFEELFRFQRSKYEVDGGEEAALFVDLLLTAASRPDAPIYVVLTMRSDFLGDCAQFPGLPELLSQSQFLIPRLTREQRRQAIEEPLRLFGATMTPQLVEQLLNDSVDEIGETSLGARYRGGAPDPLPVLQHALMRTYSQWKSVTGDGAEWRIDLKHYRDAGRMASALDQHAEDVFTRQLDDAGRKWAERIFRCLTTIELGRPVRRPTPRADLYKVIGASATDQPEVDVVLSLLGKHENSFIQINKDTSVDISHESLIWKWHRLSEWVTAEAASAELYRDLVKDAPGKATWTDPKLSATIELRKQDAWNSEWGRQYSDARFDDVAAFLLRSQEAARSYRWVRRFAGAAAVGLVILGFGLYHYISDAAQVRTQFSAIQSANADLEKKTEQAQQERSDIRAQLSELNAAQGSTKEERDRIAAEKSALEDQLARSLADSNELAAQANRRSTDLLASVQSLQSRLTQAERERDAALQDRAAEGKLRQAAETESAELKAQLVAKTSPSEESRPSAAGPSQTAAKSPAPQGKETGGAGTPQRVLLRSTGSVRSVAWNGDGKRLASAGFDLNVWDTGSGKQLVNVDNGDLMLSVAWNRDGDMLAIANYENTVELRDSAGKMLRLLRGHSSVINSVAWSSDGKMLASASDDKTVKVWDAASGRLLRTLRGHKEEVQSVAWQTTGATLASGSWDGTVKLWDGVSGKLLRTLPTPGASNSLAWSSDGKILASVGFNTATLWDAETLRVLRTCGECSQPFAWGMDNKVYATGGPRSAQKGQIALWDAASGKLLATLDGHSDALRSLAWSPDGKTLASGSSDKTLRLWDTTSIESTSQRSGP